VGGEAVTALIVLGLIVAGLIVLYVVVVLTLAALGLRAMHRHERAMIERMAGRFPERGRWR
jgi:Flp pilus assembly protein TadB